MSVRSRMLALGVTVISVAVQAVVTMPPGSAQPVAATWGPVQTLADNPRGESLVVDTLGNTTVVWARSGADRSIMAIQRPAGGSWGTPVPIGRGYAPQVAADGAGNLTVVWLSQRKGFTDGVVAAERPADGEWSGPVRLSVDRNVPGYVPGAEEVYGAARVDLAVSPGGDTVVAWDWGSDQRDKAWRIRSVDQPVGGDWSEPIEVTPASGANSPQLGVATDGTVTLLYGRQAFGRPQLLKARQRPAGGDWTGPDTVAAEGYSPELAVDLAGNAVVAYTPNFNRVRAVYRPAAGPWGAARNLSPAGITIADFDLAMNGSGTAVVALGRGNGRVDLVRRPPEGPWSGPVRVAAAGSVVYDVLVALDEAEDVFVGWGGYALYGKYLPHGGSWSERSTISPGTGVEVLEETFAVVAPDGDVVVLWKQEARPLKVRVMTAS